ncbi:hypothetical protein AUJ17_01885 [Candidatus Micrarchaeota archaeon CG1_02_47_40]|nr:MAG: hypothetical protein AUJ17_01885 [Candidatus Micrarchaeota archaeon CG1_02_47_40]
MTNFTININDALRLLIGRHPEINWSEVARQAWWEKAGQLELLDKLTAKSRASDKDVNELAALIKKGIAERHGKR